MGSCGGTGHVTINRSLALSESQFPQPRSGRFGCSPRSVPAFTALDLIPTLPHPDSMLVTSSCDRFVPWKFCLISWHLGISAQCWAFIGDQGARVCPFHHTSSQQSFRHFEEMVKGCRVRTGGVGRERGASQNRPAGRPLPELSHLITESTPLSLGAIFPWARSQEWIPDLPPQPGFSPPPFPCLSGPRVPPAH